MTVIMLYKHTNSVLEAEHTEVQNIEEWVEPGDGECVPPAGDQVLVNAIDDPEEAHQQIPSADWAKHVLHILNNTVL